MIYIDTAESHAVTDGHRDTLALLMAATVSKIVGESLWPTIAAQCTQSSRLVMRIDNNEIKAADGTVVYQRMGLENSIRTHADVVATAGSGGTRVESIREQYAAARQVADEFGSVEIAIVRMLERIAALEAPTAKAE